MTVKKSLLFLISTLLLVFFLYGCGTTGTTTPTPKEVAKAAVKKTECSIDAAPKWYSVPPSGKDKDGKVVKTYHTGAAEKSTLERAKKQAIFEAQKDLADSIDARLSKQTKEFILEAGADLITNDLNEVVKKVVREQSVGGYSLIEAHFENCKSQNVFGFVLLEYNLNTEEKVLVEEIKKEPDLDIELKRSQAYQELEEELNKTN